MQNMKRACQELGRSFQSQTRGRQAAIVMTGTAVGTLPVGLILIISGVFSDDCGYPQDSSKCNGALITMRVGEGFLLLGTVLLALLVFTVAVYWIMQKCKLHEKLPLRVFAPKNSQAFYGERRFEDVDQSEQVAAGAEAGQDPEGGIALSTLHKEQQSAVGETSRLISPSILK